MYECRFDSDQTAINLDPIDPDVFGEDEDETEDANGITEPLMPTEADGITSVIGNHRYRQTRSGAWRMVDAFGNSSLKNVKNGLRLVAHVERNTALEQSHSENSNRNNEGDHQSQRINDQKKGRA